MLPQALILIIEDEEAIVTLLSYNLEAKGYRVEVAYDGEEGLLKSRETNPDLILLDWMLPSASGLDICREIRKSKKGDPLGIIMLTARGQEEDLLRGLSAGADDYITKPFSMAELLARVEAVLRRGSYKGSERLVYKDLELRPKEHKLFRQGKAIKLGPLEYRLLCYFLERPKRVITRTQLIEALWGVGSDIETRTVDVHIRRLRKALNSGNQPDLIRTVRQVGYSLSDEESLF